MRQTAELLDAVMRDAKADCGQIEDIDRNLGVMRRGKCSCGCRCELKRGAFLDVGGGSKAARRVAKALDGQMLVKLDALPLQGSSSAAFFGPSGRAKS